MQELLRQADTAQRELIERATAEAQRTAADMRARVATEVATARQSLQAEVETIARELAKTVLGRAV